MNSYQELPTEPGPQLEVKRERTLYSWTLVHTSTHTESYARGPLLFHYLICLILKSRDITLSTKVHVVKAMVFPVVMYECESWTIKKAEYQKIDAFQLWCWRRLLRVPWTARRSNQSVLKEISPEHSLEGLMLKLKMWRTDSLEKILMLEKI